jgi:hypothetical protein
MEASLQFVDLGEGSHQRGMHGGVAGSIAAGGAGGGAGDESCGGVEEDREEVESCTLGPVVLEAQMALTELGGVVVKVAGGDGILWLAHGSLRG